MKKVSAVVLALGAMFCLAACGKGQAYVDAVCACKDTKCIAEAAQKHAEDAKGLNEEQAKKVGECTTSITTKEVGAAMSGLPGAK
jgi:hypothetical protein